jgi:hypothetical protein
MDKAKVNMDNELDRMIGTFDRVFSSLENFIFVGGPRLTLSFGWRF